MEGLMHNVTHNMTNWTDHSSGHGDGGSIEVIDHSGHNHDDDWAATALEDSSSSTPFCTSHAGHGLGFSSGGMIMYMDGFRFTLKGNQPCLNLYFPGWTLDTAGKFVAAMIGIFMLAICVEGVSKWRRYIVRSARLGWAPRPGDCRGRGSPHMLRWGITILHGVQAFLGYVLMLATMTFSAELLLSTVVGLATGYAMFFQTEADYLDETVHVSTNPCCNFMGEEANEVVTHDSNKGKKDDATNLESETAGGLEDVMEEPADGAEEFPNTV